MVVITRYLQISFCKKYDNVDKRFHRPVKYRSGIPISRVFNAIGPKLLTFLVTRGIAFKKGLASSELIRFLSVEMCGPDSYRSFISNLSTCGANLPREVENA